MIEAVIVNHNTSQFSELALRSLASCEPSAAELRITVRDNHSTDDHAAALRKAAGEVGAAFELSGWPAAEVALNSHGDVLRDFVLDHPDADYLLLVDTDIDFDQPGPVDLLLEDLTGPGAEDVWAVQARFHWSEAHGGPGASLDIWAGRPTTITLGQQIEGVEDVDLSRRLHGQIRPRLHPGCALVKNIQPVRRAAETLGFGVAWVESARPEVAGFFDTAGLASAALAVAGWRYELSRAAVHHFFNVSYQADGLEAKVADCRARLARFYPE